MVVVNIKECIIIIIIDCGVYIARDAPPSTRLQKIFRQNFHSHFHTSHVHYIAYDH